MIALLSLVLVLVLPTVAAVVALSDDPPMTTDDPELGTGSPAPAVWDVAIARGLACGLATWLIGSGLLARTVGLTTTSAWIWSGAVGAVSVGVLLLPRSRAKAARMLRPALARLGVCTAVSAVVFAPIAFVMLRTSWSPLGSTPWYYYGLARQVAETGRIPATSVEFATSTPFLSDYHLYTTATAMLLTQQPGHPITVISLVTLVAVLVLGYGVVALSSALGADRIAALLAIPVALASGIGVMRLTAYRPEGFALGLVVLVAALTLDWYRRRAWVSLATAALLVAALSQVHGIAAVTAGVMVVAGGLAYVARSPHAEHLRRAGIALAFYAAAVGVSALVFHAASGATSTGGLVDQGGISDPTWEFYRAGRAYLPSAPPSNSQMLYHVPGYLYGRSWWWIVPALVLAGVGLWRQRRLPSNRFLVVFTLLTLVGLALVGSVFMFGWQGYVPRRTGASRLPLDASLLAPPWIAVGLGSLARESWRWRRRTVPERRRRPILLVALVACTLVSLVSVARYVGTQAPTRQDLAVWESLPMAKGDVVLANAYTEGFIPDVTPAEGLLDGRAPYTFDALLHRANGLFRGAQGFFVDPSAHWSYLRDNDVSWVVVGEPGTFAMSTGNTWLVPSDPDALARCPGLERVAENDPRITVFRVVDSGPAGCAVARGQ